VLPQKADSFLRMMKVLFSRFLKRAIFCSAPGQRGCEPIRRGSARRKMLFFLTPLFLLGGLMLHCLSCRAATEMGNHSENAVSVKTGPDATGPVPQNIAEPAGISLSGEREHRRSAVRQVDGTAVGIQEKNKPGNLKISGENPVSYKKQKSLARKPSQIQPLNSVPLEENIHQFISYSNPSRQDFIPANTSPTIDAGAQLTVTTGNSNGTTHFIAVEDVLFFSDGFGITGGDWIRVGDQPFVQILSINERVKTLRVNRPLSYQAGQPVSRAYEGENPDVGIFESGLDPLPEYGPGPELASEVKDWGIYR
jgi:hypothetical protein